MTKCTYSKTVQGENFYRRNTSITRAALIVHSGTINKRPNSVEISEKDRQCLNTIQYRSKVSGHGCQYSIYL